MLATCGMAVDANIYKSAGHCYKSLQALRFPRCHQESQIEGKVIVAICVYNSGDFSYGWLNGFSMVCDIIGVKPLFHSGRNTHIGF